LDAHAGLYDLQSLQLTYESGLLSPELRKSPWSLPSSARNRSISPRMFSRDAATMAFRKTVWIVLRTGVRRSCARTSALKPDFGAGLCTFFCLDGQGPVEAPAEGCVSTARPTPLTSAVRK